MRPIDRIAHVGRQDRSLGKPWLNGHLLTVSGWEPSLDTWILQRMP
jgi:hypothetical protein